MTTWDPSAINRALTPEFLTPVVDAIWRVQRKVSRHVQPSEGDDDWVAGCTAFRRRVVALTKLATDERYRDWLWAGYIGGQFWIKILGFPIRIYRSPEEGGIPDKYALVSEEELSLLRDLRVPAGSAYRIEVVSRKLARPHDILLVELDAGGTIQNSMSIPRSRDVDAPVSKTNGSVQPIRRRKPPVIPPRPKVQPNEEKKQVNPNQEERPA